MVTDAEALRALVDLPPWQTAVQLIVGLRDLEIDPCALWDLASEVADGDEPAFMLGALFAAARQRSPGRDSV